MNLRIVVNRFKHCKFPLKISLVLIYDMDDPRNQKHANHTYDLRGDGVTIGFFKPYTKPYTNATEHMLKYGSDRLDGATMDRIWDATLEFAKSTPLGKRRLQSFDLRI
jgi:hypothetical protein